MGGPAPRARSELVLASREEDALVALLLVVGDAVFLAPKAPVENLSVAGRTARDLVGPRIAHRHRPRRRAAGQQQTTEHQPTRDHAARQRAALLIWPRGGTHGGMVAQLRPVGRPGAFRALICRLDLLRNAPIVPLLDSATG
jgi:hypothetical protein